MKDNAKFKPPPFLYPTNKPIAPFRLWCLDTMVGLRPPSPTGATDVILAVDPFTKWVEARELSTLNSHNTTVFLHNEIVCRYGHPHGIRSDRGTEFSGEFREYLKRHGIVHSLISTRNPRANGQVERYVAIFKAGMRRFLDSCPGGRWWEFIADVARGVRLQPTKATGYSPY